ncbi:Immunoglobulin-like domain of spore germination [Lihuaxuella thermophila]|uniref:Immunoglobulin-like domain of spore germination n=2 Tax=Lihuaxuella thermophila TaxID=1173111 RepID=A0A1H8FJW4_9BACL|nr:Immunoglobulin-like domain of spore germination [Lihuaxuella thermophila]
MENNAFRNLRLQGEKGHYTLMGEARVLEGNFRYAVSDGHDYLVEGSVQVQGGAPEWAAFTLKLSIPDEKLPRKGTLTLELFEISPKDGSRQNELIIPLDTFQ